MKVIHKETKKYISPTSKIERYGLLTVVCLWPRSLSTVNTLSLMALLPGFLELPFLSV